MSEGTSRRYVSSTRQRVGNANNPPPLLTHIYSAENSSVFWDCGAWPFCPHLLRHQTKVVGTIPVETHFVPNGGSTCARNSVILKRKYGSYFGRHEQKPRRRQSTDQRTCKIRRRESRTQTSIGRR